MDVVPHACIDFAQVRRRYRHHWLGPLVLSALLLGCVVAGAVGLQRLFGGPSAPPWWVVLLASPVVLLVGGVLLLATQGVISMFCASLRSTNWLVLEVSDGLYLNLRSFGNCHFPMESARAAFVPFAEIMSARRVTERFPPTAGTSRRVPDPNWLELELVHPHTTTLDLAVQAERTREAPQRRFLGITSRSREVRTTCFVARPGVVGVEWLGRRLLRNLETKVRIEAPLKYTLGGDSEARALELLRRGEVLAATQLLRAERGLSLLEAKQELEALGKRAA